MPVTLAPSAAHSPRPTSPFTLGVEEELFVTDPVTLDPVPGDAVLHRRGRFLRGRIVGEMCDGVVELATPICDTAGGAAAALSELRREVARRAPVALLGVGVHPTLAFGDVRHRRNAHYDAVSEDTRSLLRQTTYCGVHVHVGMPDPETTIAAFNGMRKWIPLLQALSANSPFWYGRDSGLASSRTVICHTLPRTGLPRAFRDWADYEATMARVCATAEVLDASSVWWDMRAHPRFGTLEVRCLDAQSSLKDLESLVGLVHALVVHEALAGDDRHPDVEILQEATFRALRDGVHGRMSLGGPVRPVREHALMALDIAGGYRRQLEIGAQLDHVGRMLDEGNGAVRQRRAFAEGGMAAVLQHLRAQTMPIAALDEVA